MSTPDGFDRKRWIRRFGEALEETAAGARLVRLPFGLYGTFERGFYRREMYRRYRAMAELARSDPYAAKLFDESHVWLDVLPDGVLELLLEHPVIEHASRHGSNGAFRFVYLVGGGQTDLKFLIAHLSKLSVRVGGERAATILHRFLVAGEGVRLHAHEITVLHGLKLDKPIPLGRGAYLASYDGIRRRLGLPEDPEPWLRRNVRGVERHPARLVRTSSPGVLVRHVRWGPAVAPYDCPANLETPLRRRYRFPDDHRVESVTRVREERETLVHLLSIALRSKLVCHTVINAVPPWMARLDPNLRTRSTGGHLGVFDVWPKDQVPCRRDLYAFVAAARGWLTFCSGKADRSTELATRRTASSFGIPGGRFGVEDRLIDAGIALEAMYGPFGRGSIRHSISSRAARLLGESLAEGRTIARQMKSFYDTRSKVVHGTVSRDRQRREREFVDALKSGRELARRTLLHLLARGPINDESEWDALIQEGARCRNE